MPEAAETPAIDEDGLYQVVPEQFVAARNALVRRLRSNGAKAESARVAALRRPPPTAWALNQVARTAPSLIEQVLVAGFGLRAAMERALAGDASGLRPAQGEERVAVDAVVAAGARGLELRGVGVTDPMRSRMASTLRAAIVDEMVATRLRRGVLQGDHDASGFGMDALAGCADDRSPAFDPPSADQPGAAVPSAPAAIAQRRQRDETRRRDAEEEAIRLSAAAEELSAEADRLAGEADRLGEEAERLALQAERTAAQAHHARQLGAAARLRADAAAHRAAAAVTAVTVDTRPAAADRPR